LRLKPDYSLDRLILSSAVVIGSFITATVLTLLIFPVIYRLFNRRAVKPVGFADKGLLVN